MRRDVLRLEEEGVVTRRNGKVFLNEDQRVHAVLSSYGLLTREERLQEIAELLQKKKHIRVSHLSKLYNVTTTTIRSDLAELHARGLATLGHGFARVADNGESRLATAVNRSSEKRIEQIVARATTHIESGDVLFIDDSVFGHGIAASLQHATDITVVTNSLQVAYTLSNRDYSCNIVTLSGALRSFGNDGGPLISKEQLEKLAIKKAFIGIASLGNDGFLAPANGVSRQSALELFHATQQLFLCLSSDSIGVQPVSQDRLNLREIEKYVSEFIIDEAADTELAKSLFPESVPVALCGVGHTSYLGRTSNMKIGFAVYPGHTDFRQQANEGIENACKNRPEFTLHRRHNSGTYDTIIDNVDRLIEEGVDLLIDYSTNYEVGVLVAQKTQELGIPLIMVDLHVPNTYYFGANNVYAGQMAGEAAAMYINEQWHGDLDHILVLEKQISGAVCAQRVIGSIHAVKQCVRISTRAVRHIDCTHGINYYRQKLTRYFDRVTPGERCLVISYAEDTTVETHDLIREYARDRRIVMVAQNHSHHVEQLMEQPDSPLLGCVSYAQDTYGERIMELATRILNNETVSPVNYTEHTWIPNAHAPPDRRSLDVERG